MNKYSKTIKILSKLVVSTQLNSTVFTEVNKYAKMKMCLDRKTMTPVVHKSSIRHHNRSCDKANGKKNPAETKNSVKCEKKLSKSFEPYKHINHINFIYDLLNVFSQPKF